MWINNEKVDSKAAADWSLTEVKQEAGELIIMRDRRLGLFHILSLMFVLATYKTICSPNWTTNTHNVRVFVIF